MSHSPRFSLPQINPEAYRGLSSVEAAIAGGKLEKKLIHLVKMRASQINGCAFCLDMHSKDARKEGETEQRLYLLNAWSEAGLYTEREQAALEWTDHLTRISTEGAPQTTYDRLSAVFSPTEIADLTVLIGMINLWNRVAIGSGAHPAAINHDARATAA